MSDDNVIAVKGLYKYYGRVKAVDGVSFDVQAGEIFGMVGPNGSGKTTTIECIEGFRQPDRGIIKVLGLDPGKDSQALRERVGVQLQTANLPNRIRVEEALDLFSSFYKHKYDWQPLLETFGLAGKRRAYFQGLSGGQKQRLFVALALINRPQVVFLDELTTGLDPQARRATWDVIRKIRERGTTIYLTTHFMDEAEQLCDRVAILDHGNIIALDTPGGLVQGLQMGTRITFQINGHNNRNPMKPSITTGFDSKQLSALHGVQRVEQDGNRMTIYGNGEDIVGAVIRELEKKAIPYHNLQTAQANLEDVFLALTGRPIVNFET